MRFELLFDDLGSRLESALDSGAAARRAEGERMRIARLTLRDRLEALRAAGEPVRLVFPSDQVVVVTVLALGRDWLSARSGRDEFIVPLAAVAALSLTREQVQRSLVDEVLPTRGIERRIPFAIALRDLARRRANLWLVTRGGGWHGTIDRVGSDHLDLAVHPAGTPRRERAVVDYRTIALDDVLCVRL